MGAKKSLSQNFLVDYNIQKKIVDLVPPSAPSIAEIGPGKGALTKHLIKKTPLFTAIEKDDTFAKLIEDTFKCRVIHSDVLTVDLSTLQMNTTLVSNAPYNISTQLFIHIFRHRDIFSKCILMFQKEFVRKVAPPDGTTTSSMLSFLCWYGFTSKRPFTVSPGCFFPRPKVISEILTLSPIERKLPVDDSLLIKTLEELYTKPLRPFIKKECTLLFNEDVIAFLHSIGRDEKTRIHQLTADQLLSLLSLLLTK